MSDLASIFGGLVRYHIATAAQPLPERTPGISWIVAANGVFKRGVSADLDLLIAIERRPVPIPGLTQLMPHVRWQAWQKRIPGKMLASLLDDARRAMSDTAIARPIEKQYFFVWRDRDLRLVAPRAQQATASRVRYAMPTYGSLLVDVHSHHELPAFFSSTDDADDAGLSVSAVIGRIFTRPELRCRLNVYGHRVEVPPTILFDHLGPFRAASEDVYSEDVYADLAA